MPGRTVVFGAQYRFGFNGKENDNDVKGPGNQQDYGMRIYDPRIGKFLSVDPLNHSFPWYTPYQFAGNKPINSVDLDGLEEKLAIYTFAKDEDDREIISYMQIKLEAHQQTPERGNNGILTKYYYQNPRTGKTDFFEVYERQVEVKKKGFWNQLFGRSEWLPQIQVFGSGTESLAEQADPTKPLVSFNLNADEMWFLLKTGIEGPEKFGPLAEIDKFEEAAKFLQKLTEKEVNNQLSEKQKSEPVIIRETKQGKWNYFIWKQNGSEGEFTSSEKDQLIPGKNGAPDTIKQVQYSQPPLPQKDIPKRKN